MQTGNIRQFLRWGYSCTWVNHEVSGENPAPRRTPSEGEIYVVEESDIRTEPVRPIA
jgi:hypothetical protein